MPQEGRRREHPWSPQCQRRLGRAQGRRDGRVPGGISSIFNTSRSMLTARHASRRSPRATYAAGVDLRHITCRPPSQPIAWVLYLPTVDTDRYPRAQPAPLVQSGMAQRRRAPHEIGTPRSLTRKGFIALLSAAILLYREGRRDETGSHDLQEHSVESDPMLSQGAA